ncbi:MAG TPA: DUF2157 domain-containing protein [Chitinispirillaceae bacterium]|nr:DUF2157 domain-containing protein [Chitinispirillaceae bacterium]
MPDEILNEKFSLKVIYLLAKMDHMSEEVLSSFYSIAGFKPGIQSWISFISKLVLSLGLLFTVTGVIFFFAYNWSELHKFAKLSIVGGAILASTIIALFSELNKFHAKLSLLAVAVFTGSLLAVFGQIYQTGANAYDLFLNWAILITGIVLISNFKPLWFLWLTLINTAIILFAGQILWRWIDPFVFISLFIVNTIALIIYEYFSYRKNPKFDSRWLPRIIGFAIIFSMTVAGIVGIITEFEDYGHAICLLLALGSYVTAFFFYSRKVYDLSSIAVSCVCIIAMVFTVILKARNFDTASIFFIGGFIIVGLTITSAFILIKINKAWKTQI